ncbi:hypothetical protein BT96DRAFT_968490 [Gymnopus androsaceus JB14]|uniref:SPRY domain-containing protein n=1 Tax=Gymnopus androsaceus JB14 TaxID=1447944 RepID=A0A6A4GIH3_9AGAR|nr:hypothetical protein BT96DRAFT_968490 [Gymnopus androsaceus JB14]
MTNLFKSLKSHIVSHDTRHEYAKQESRPPEWAAAPEISHTRGQYNEAPDQEFRDGLSFCQQNPLSPPSLFPTFAIDRIKAEGAKAWGLQLPSSQDRFSGRVDNIPPDSKERNVVHVATDRYCKDYCLLSDLPIGAGLYDTHGREGVYFEVAIHEMHPPESFIAIGTSCLPYPVFRLPGWNRQSSGWHLDDLRKFFEDPDGGRDYTHNGQPLPLPYNPQNRREQYIPSGSTIGCGYTFKTGSIFYTFNGIRLPNAFDGAHLPRHERDVFAAIGVSGQTNFDVNFGGEPFRWWRVEGIVERLTFGEASSSAGDELPAYSR